jgi:hypothetical protein
MRGDYSYSPIKFIVTKITEVTNIKDNTKSLQQQFMDGEYTAASTITIAFKNGLKKGDYLLLYQSEFTDLHPMKKLVLSVYCEDSTVL